ncbi:MAG: hypothetical protein ABIH99_04530, partial [Candidatus Micrarchaeota archaeon]
GSTATVLFALALATILYYYVLARKLQRLHKISGKRINFAFSIFVVVPLILLLASLFSASIPATIIYNSSDVLLSQADLPEHWTINSSKTINLETDIGLSKEQTESYKSLGLNQVLFEKIDNKPANRFVSLMVYLFNDEQGAKTLYEFNTEDRNFTLSDVSFGNTGKQWLREDEGLYFIGFRKNNVYILVGGEDRTEVTSIAWILDAKLQEIKK